MRWAIARLADRDRAAFQSSEGALGVARTVNPPGTLGSATISGAGNSMRPAPRRASASATRAATSTIRSGSSASVAVS